MVQKILVIDGHPDTDQARFGHALAHAYLKGAMEAGKETPLITLAETPVEFLRCARDFAAPPRTAK